MPFTAGPHQYDFHLVFPAMTGVLAELCVVFSWSGQFLSACSWEGLVHLKTTVVSQHLVPIAQCSLHRSRECSIGTGETHTLALP